MPATLCLSTRGVISASDVLRNIFSLDLGEPATQSRHSRCGHDGMIVAYELTAIRPLPTSNCAANRDRLILLNARGDAALDARRNASAVKASACDFDLVPHGEL